MKSSAKKRSTNSLMLTRRHFVFTSIGLSTFIYAQWLGGKARPRYQRSPDLMQLHYNDQKWQQLLAKNAYQVLRQAKTERRHSSPLIDEWRPGTYICKACDLSLFEHNMKFYSASGWPSFHNHIHGHLETYTDFQQFPPQQGYRCARCLGHQGHLIMDGPLPSGERWCNNGIALRFIAQAKIHLSPA